LGLCIEVPANALLNTADAELLKITQQLTPGEQEEETEE
jgi:hypothetical protein